MKRSTRAALVLVSCTALGACTTMQDTPREGVARSALLPIDEDPPDPTDPPPPDPGTGTGQACNDPRGVYFRHADGTQSCSGIVLSSTLILTAAHCAFDDHGNLKDIGKTTVGVGGAGCAYGDTTIAQAKRHPKYGQPSTMEAYDLAVVKLSSPLSNVTPVTLGSASMGTAVTVSGFGVGGVDGQSQTCTPGTVAHIMPTLGDDGTSLNENVVSLELNMGTNRICRGDSGGGVFAANGHLVGVISSTQGTASCGNPAFAGKDWGFVQAAINDMTGASNVQCTAGATRTCRPQGAACLASTVGACHYGTATCANGVWGACTGFQAPTTEACGNGIDDNCNGTVDENCSTGGGGGGGGDPPGGGGGGTSCGGCGCNGCSETVTVSGRDACYGGSGFAEYCINGDSACQLYDAIYCPPYND